MSDPAPRPPRRFEQQRDLFQRACSLPAKEREAFVRANAPDEALANEVLSLLRTDPATTPELLYRTGDEVRDATPSEARSPGNPDRVQSTATGELLAKLAKAPKLDEERFSLEGEVGKGGMGAVLKIHDRFLNRRLAMKVLLERPAPRDDDERRLGSQLLGRFLEEAQVTSQLDHPGVVPVHELGLDANGRVWFTMRLVKGRTASEVFADAFAERNDWTVTRALEVALKVCDTMAYAHDKGVLHRDLKPGNVMVGRFGEVYVMDWGLAKVRGQADQHDLRIAKSSGTAASKIESARKRDRETDAASSVVSMDGQQLGTPSYMSPEQARSEDVDARADVYAIGAMLYELLTGRPPYVVPGSRKPPYRILDDVLEGPPKGIEEIRRGVPAELVAIVEKAMARAQAERFASVTDLANDLRAFLAQRTVKAYRTGALVEMRLWMRRNRALASALAVAAVILVLGIVGTTTAWAKVAAQNGKNEVLADVAILADLRRQEATLYPAFPDRVPAMEAWLRMAEPIVARLALREATLTDLRTHARPVSEERRHAAQAAHPRAPELTKLSARLAGENDSSKRADLQEQIRSLQNEIAVAGYAFDDPTDSSLNRTLALLVKELGEFAARTLPDVQKRLDEARSVQKTTIDDHRTRWDEAIAAIEASDDVHASKLYGGFTLHPQLGLVPIGMDKDSKLWEFVHLASGTPGKAIPARAAKTGRITPTCDMGIVFVLLPGGTLPEGTPTDDEGAKKRRTVKLDPFFLGKYEITQGQWARLTGDNPSYSRKENDLALPVEDVDWFDSAQTLRHMGCSLPSELQWEYGVRAGTATTWWTGDDEAGIEAAENVGRGADRLLPVGSKAPNGFGLFDMGGNVWEWCLDPYSVYGTEQAIDGRRPDPDDGATVRSTRGSSFVNDAAYAGSGVRFPSAPAGRAFGLGLRAARACSQ